MAMRTREIIETIEVDASELDLHYTIADADATPPGSLRCDVSWEEDGQRVTKHVIVTDQQITPPEGVAVCQVTTRELDDFLALHRQVQASAFDDAGLGVAAG